MESSVFELTPLIDIPKKEYYEKELAGFVPDAFFVLGGGNRKIEKPDKHPRFTTSPYRGKFYPEKTGGAKARPIAAVELSLFYPNAKIVTMSHRPTELFQLAAQQQVTDAPSFAAVIDGDLRRFGVKNEIIQNPASTSTLTEIMEVIKLTAKNSWKTSAVVTNDYQIERANKILNILQDTEKRKVLKNQLQFLFSSGSETETFNTNWDNLEISLEKMRQENANIIFVSAENVLSRRDPHYRELVKKLKEDTGYKNICEQERIGNEKIDEGKYNFAQSSFKEYILALN